eukprot:3680490-Rhodomonas_salina.1
MAVDAGGFGRRGGRNWSRRDGRGAAESRREAKVCWAFRKGRRLGAGAPFLSHQLHCCAWVAAQERDIRLHSFSH